MYRLESTTLEKLDSNVVLSWLTDLNEFQMYNVIHGLRTSDYVYVVYKDDEVVAVFGYKHVEFKIAYLGVFYILPKWRKSRAILEVRKYITEVMAEYSIVRYTPVAGGQFPIRYCKRRTIDMQQAYKDSHGG